MPTVTIGFFPREQFSLAAESLQRILDYTDIPFNLIIVDCDTPALYWQQVEQLIKDRRNVRVIHVDHYLLPNQSRNLLVKEVEDEFLCLIENDVLVSEGWLSRLVSACEETPADVAVPLIIEGRPGSRAVHWDPNAGCLQEVKTDGGPKWEILPATGEQRYDPCGRRRAMEFLEDHCILFRRCVFDRIAEFDESLTQRQHIDLSIALHHAKVPIVYEPEAIVHFWHPYPPAIEDLDFFFMRWDIALAAKSCERIRNRWNLIELPGDHSFAIERNRIGHLYEVRDKLRLLMSQEPFILADEGSLIGNKIIEGFNAIPFTERNGQYWGAPADDDAAIRELERLRHKGACAIAFLWPTFWWLDHYSRFHDYLFRHFPCLSSDDRMLVFGLQP